MRIKINPHGVRSLETSAGALEAVARLGEATAEACNRESSWGGYFSSASVDGIRARARVWSADDRNDEGRDNRLVRNLGGGA